MNTITLYHGSNRIFETFRIAPELSNKSFVLMEGLGVYLTEQIDVARHYGSHLYHVQVDPSIVLDFTNKVVLKKQIQQFKRAFQLHFPEISIDSCITAHDIDLWLTSIVNGTQSATNFASEFGLLIDNSEYFWEHGGVDIEEALEEIKQIENEWLSKHIIKYHDNSLGIVYIAKNEALVQHVERMSGPTP